jgi:uncharacterized protein YdaU (DUF1376 family)
MADDLRSWFPLYVADMLNSRKVRKMNAQEFGIFMFLLLEQWIGGPLPEDRADLLDMAKCPNWESVHLILQAQFVLTDKGWVNERLVDIWKEQDAKIRRKSRAGKAGAEARWGKKLIPAGSEEDPVGTEEDDNRIPPATATAMPSQSDTNGNESRREEKREDKKESIIEIKPKKRGAAKDDVIRIRNGLRWGEIEHPAKRGYKEITREYFEDVMYVTKSDDEFPVDLVIETQEELDVWLSATA